MNFRTSIETLRGKNVLNIQISKGLGLIFKMFSNF